MRRTLARRSAKTLDRIATTSRELVESIGDIVWGINPKRDASVTCSSGGAPMSPEVARRVVELFRRFKPPERAEYHLTPYQLRVLGMLVDGHNYQTAAAELGVTVHAVSFHMRHVYEKLGVHSKSEAVARALRQRLFA